MTAYIDTLAPHFVFIHGANQTSSSWSHILAHLQPKNYTLIEYNSKHPFAYNLEQMTEQLSNTENIFFVAHSLGGIYSLYLYEQYKENVVGAVTISTPYGGSSLARFLRYMFPTYQIFKDICPTSPAIYLGNQVSITVPWTQIVSTGGHHPIHILPNDGVVTINSMMNRSDIDYLVVNEDHYDVMYSNEVINTIKNLSKTT